MRISSLKYSMCQCEENDIFEENDKTRALKKFKDFCFYLPMNRKYTAQEFYLYLFFLFFFKSCTAKFEITIVLVK